MRNQPARIELGMKPILYLGEGEIREGVNPVLVEDGKLIVHLTAEEMNHDRISVYVPSALIQTG